MTYVMGFVNKRGCLKSSKYVIVNLFQNLNDLITNSFLESETSSD